MTGQRKRSGSAAAIKIRLAAVAVSGALATSGAAAQWHALDRHLAGAITDRDTPASTVQWIAQTESAAPESSGRRRDVRRPGREPKPVPAPAGAPGSPAATETESGGTTPQTVQSPADTGLVEANGREPLPEVELGKLGGLTAVPDRWRIVDALGYPRNLLDPYNSANVLKADRRFNENWFFNLGAISDTVIEPRYVPTPVGNATTARAGSNDTIGDGEQLLFSETLLLEFVLYQGNTVFRPPDVEYRFIPAFNVNQLRTQERGVVKVDPAEGDDGGTDRTESFAGIQTLFADYHLRNVSDRYDFDSLRIGIQPMTADFRGFLFLDQPVGVRLFGTRDNNRYQYNLAWFRRIEKEINSGLNDLSEGLRDDDVLLANLYAQDFPVLGFTSQATVVYNRNRESDEQRYDENGFLSRPSSLFDERGREYDLTYLGYNGDGHIGRLNLSVSAYYSVGTDSLPGAANRDRDIAAYFAAVEGSVDFDWIRVRFSGLYGSGDDDPFDDKAAGFDAIFENPQFAGADSSYWIRQAVPLIGGGGVALSARNGVLNSLRSSKEQGQSNFINPGIALLGVGADFDVLPELRISANVNQLWFNETAVLEALRQQGAIDQSIGTDVSIALTYRPWLSQNIVLRLSGAMLLPGDGFTQLYGDDETPYSILANIILAY